MSDPAKPAWSASAAFPFMPFPIPGLAATTAPAAAPPSPLAGGFDLLKSLWSGLPGASHVPGFLVPTVDVDELDKRISDLRAAESWVEVNLNMLRSTIQALEVQRHTIAALHSLSAVGEPAAATPRRAEPVADAPPPAVAAEAAAVPVAAAPWLAYLQDQFARVATAALATTTSGTTAAKAPLAAKPPKKRAPPRR